MKLNISRLSVTAAASAALLALASASAPAQQAPAPAPHAETLPAGQVLVQIGQNAGVTVLADSTIQGRLSLPAVPATAATVEQQIAEAVGALPAGTTWAKLYVPAPANGRWSGDAVAEYVRALAQMVGTVGRTAPAGMVEILGRTLPADKANEYITALNLRLVYLVSNPRAQTPTATGFNMASNWTQMTPAQRELYIQQQAQRVMAMDPASRFQMLRGLMENQEISPQQALIKSIFSQMTDDERVALKQSFAGGKPAAGGGK
jgi:hypothetical protein